MYYCYIFIGPSGSGKTSLAAEIFSKEQKIISTTTRLPRPDEKDGVDYFFVSKQQFEEMIQQDLFAEYDSYADNYYGVTKAEISKQLQTNDCYNVLTLQGFLSLEKIFGSSAIIPVLIHVSKETVALRLGQRGETSENIRERMQLFEEEITGYTVLSDYPNLLRIDGNQSLEQMAEEFRQQMAAAENED